MHNFYLWPCKTPPAAGIPLEDTLSNGGFNGDITGPLALLTLTATPLDGETVSIGGVTYVFQTTLTNENCNVLIGGSTTNAAANLIAAINGGGGAGTSYASTCDPHPSVVASSQGTGTVVIEGPPGGIAGEPPITTPSVGKLPTDLATHTPFYWYRADQRRAHMPNNIADGAVVMGWGSIGDVEIPQDNILTPYNNYGATASRATFVEDGGAAFNNKPIIDFVGGDGRKMLAAGPAPTVATSPMHMFVVGLLTTLTPPPNLHFIGSGTVLFSCIAANTISQTFSGNNPIAASINTVYLIEGFFNNQTTSYMRLNRGAKVTGEAAADIAGGGPVYVGANGGNALNGDCLKLTEFILFDGAGGGEVTGQDYTDLTDYLSDRYGLTLA